MDDFRVVLLPGMPELPGRLTIDDIEDPHEDHD